MPYLNTIGSVGKPNVYKQTAKGAGLPITVLEAKSQLFIRASVTTWDTEIEAYINAGMAFFENMTRQTLIEATYIGYFNTFTRSLLLKRAPFRATIAVTYFDENNVEQTVGTSNYYTTESDYYSHLIFVDTFEIPKTFDRPQILKVEFNAGISTDETDTPEDIKQGLKMYVAHMYENRGDCVAQGDVPEVIASHFYPYKILDIARNDIQ